MIGERFHYCAPSTEAYFEDISLTHYLVLAKLKGCKCCWQKGTKMLKTSPVSTFVKLLKGQNKENEDGSSQSQY